MASRTREPKGSGMDTMDVNGRLWQAALRVAQEADLTFDEECAEAMLAFIGAGVVQMEAEGVATKEPSILRAEENIIRFVTEMVADAQENKARRLKRSGFERIRKLLCPIWPFCPRG